MIDSSDEVRFEGQVQEVAEGVFRIGVPLPNNPLRELNSYLIEGDRPLLVDVGFDLDACEDALREGLATLGHSFDDVDLLFTHSHPDHCGAVSRVHRPGMTVYAGFPDFFGVAREYHVHNRGFRAWLNGGYELLPAGETRPPVTDLEVRQILEGSIDYSEMDEVRVPLVDTPLTLLRDGDELRVGSRTFTVVSTTGHCPDHICLYDAHDRILIAGDQVLYKITPVIACFALGETVLSDYHRSIDKLAALDVSLVLPGHRSAYRDLPGRVDQLHRHHDERAAEVLEALHTGASSVVDVARGISWHTPYATWEEWPLKQKYFAIGETIAHLSYLEEKGFVEHVVTGGSLGTLGFRLKDGRTGF